jgi:hypothetical protein
LQNFSCKDHHCLVEVLIWFLIWEDFRLELHEWATMLHLVIVNWFIVINDPSVFICHFLCFFIKFLLLWRQDLRNRETTLLSFLFENLLFVFKAEQFSAIV